MKKHRKVIKSSPARQPHCNCKLLRPSRPLLIAILAGLLTLASTCFAQLQTNLPDAPDASRQSDPTNRPDGGNFADLVRDDFFAGDSNSLQRVVKVCEDALAQNPTNAPALSWHGAALLRQSGQAYRTGDYAKGASLWQRGMKEMNDAVALQPDSVHVLLPRAAAFESIAKRLPDPVESKRLLTTAVSDYEKVLKLQQQQGSFSSLSLHARGELLSGLAEGSYRTGQTDKSLQYLRLITNDLAGSTYAKNAGSWLESLAAKTPNKPATLTCIGCHSP
jgi:hypothetical protein